ncbi:patatin family protein [candidate division Kazan bacterium]|uniref:Patatin family protein n=1 Tax=candidate division Kazan bacterium TaxID=2202143 RepID=A0A420ZDR5_UNCK3|nr:MAG: patatin family protein [candidate division Kazan bacterium]
MPVSLCGAVHHQLVLDSIQHLSLFLNHVGLPISVQIVSMNISTNRPQIGLALGSGGSRGLAHIGVIKALEEAGIPVDYIAGSSIGAMIGGVYAIHKDITLIEKALLSVGWKKALSLIDVSVKQGLIRGSKIEKIIQSQVGSVNMEKLMIPTTIVATDLMTGKPVYFNQGDLTKAIRASISVPLVFRPVTYHGQILADGGLSMPVPVKAARDMGADIVIAVNIEGDLFDYRRVSKPGFMSIALTSIDALRYNLADREAGDADVVITIHSRSGKLIDEVAWDTKKLISVGERYTKAALPKIRRLI